MQSASCTQISDSPHYIMAEGIVQIQPFNIILTIKMWQNVGMRLVLNMSKVILYGCTKYTGALELCPCK